MSDVVEIGTPYYVAWQGESETLVAYAVDNARGKRGQVHFQVPKRGAVAHSNRDLIVIGRVPRAEQFYPPDSRILPPEPPPRSPGRVA